MATHDYNIANQGFPAFRADLNDALAAIVSNNSNATAPATTFAHMLWVDTAANPSVLKIRNADNDAWITIGSINQTDDKFKLTPADGISTDTISELTSAAGVTIDGVLLKDTTVTANTIKASGTSSSQGEVQLFEDTDNGTNYVAIKAPASIAANVTWTLPNADGTADQVLKTNGSGVLGWATSGGINSGTAQASTSGTSIDFTGIPSWVKRVTVILSGVSTNGSSSLRLQLGDSGGVETTGYSNLSCQMANSWSGAATSSSGFDGYGDGGAGFLRSGHLVFVTLGSNIWTLVGVYTIANGSAFSYFFTGVKTLSATLDRIRITTVNGTDTFDAGSINILYE